MRFTSLGSGSQGNALLVQAAGPTDSVCFLVDCGLSLKDALDRLSSRGLSPSDLDFILVTHEHGDHIGGAARLARSAGIPVFATHGTLLAAGPEFFAGVQTVVISSHQPFLFGSVGIQPVPVPHDAREPISIVISSGDQRLGIVTDLGSLTRHLVDSLQGLTGLFLEFNHDRRLLREGAYPQSLKSRVGGDWGHLSNDQAAGLLADCLHSELKIVIAAHLSQQNNRPELVMQSVQSLTLGRTQFEIASQDSGLDWVCLQPYHALTEPVPD